MCLAPNFFAKHCKRFLDHSYVASFTPACLSTWRLHLTISLIEKGVVSIIATNLLTFPISRTKLQKTISFLANFTQPIPFFKPFYPQTRKPCTVHYRFAPYKLSSLPPCLLKVIQSMKIIQKIVVSKLSLLSLIDSNSRIWTPFCQ